MYVFRPFFVCLFSGSAMSYLKKERTADLHRRHCCCCCCGCHYTGDSLSCYYTPRTHTPIHSPSSATVYPCSFLSVSSAARQCPTYKKGGPLISTAATAAAAAVAATALVTDKHVTTPHPPSHPHTHLLALLCHRPLSHLTRLAARNDSTRCHGAVGEAPTCDTTNRLCLPTTSSRRPSSCSALLTARETLSRIILEREGPDRPTNPPPPLFHCPVSFGGHGLLLQTAFSTGRNNCSVS